MKNNFRYAGRDAVTCCMSCAHWRLSDSRIKGLGKCAIAVGLSHAHSYSGPQALCADYETAHPKAIAKRKEILA